MILILRVRGLDGVVEHRVPVRVVAGGAAVEEVLVADLDVGHSERCRVPVGRAPRSPGGRHRAGRVLDLVQRVLDVRSQVGLGHDGAVEGEPRQDGHHRGRAEILGELEVLQQAQAVVGPVAPGRVLVALGVPDRADGLLPVPARPPVVDGDPFDVVAAGEAEDLRAPSPGPGSPGRDGARSAGFGRWAGTARPPGARPTSRPAPAAHGGRGCRCRSRSGCWPTQAARGDGQRGGELLPVGIDPVTCVLAAVIRRPFEAEQ